MVTTTLNIEPRYKETDQMGVVHHSNYLVYFELGRLEWLSALGLSYASMESSGLLLPVYKVSIEYKKPLIFGTSYKLYTSVRNVPTSRIYFHYSLTNSADAICTISTVELVFTNKKTFRPTRPPNYFLEAFLAASK